MSSRTSSKEAAAPAAPVVPTEDPAAYDENRMWRETPWGDTYWCEMCSTCMRWRYSHRAKGRVCVTSYNFNFPLVLIENGRCNEYRPVPGAETLWAEEPYIDEEEEYEMRRRDGDGYDDDGDGRRRSGGGSTAAQGARRRTRRRPRRSGGGGQAGNGA